MSDISPQRQIALLGPTFLTHVRSLEWTLSTGPAARISCNRDLPFKEHAMVVCFRKLQRALSRVVHARQGLEGMNVSGAGAVF